jgi:hypothetical protein
MILQENCGFILLSIRPAQLADLAKKLCQIERVEVQALSGARFWIDRILSLGTTVEEDTGSAFFIRAAYRF